MSYGGWKLASDVESSRKLTLDMLKMYVDDGMSLREIGDWYGVTPQAVRMRIKDHLGPDGPRVETRRQRSTREMAAIYSRLMAGTSTIKEEAARRGTTTGTLRSLLRRAGYSPREAARPRHGTYSGYASASTRCRCERCKEAARAHWRDYYDRVQRQRRRERKRERESAS